MFGIKVQEFDARQQSGIPGVAPGSSSAYLGDGEDSTPRNQVYVKPIEQVIGKDEFDVFLRFSSKEDEPLYKKSFKNLFYFPTFLPWFAVIIIMIAVQSDTTHDKGFVGGGVFSTVLLSLRFVYSIMLIAFLVAQTIQYLQSYVPQGMRRFRKLVLRKFAYGYIEDIILGMNSLIGGLGLFYVTVNNVCSSSSRPYAAVMCTEETKEFPLHYVFFVFIMQLVLPIFLKSTHRHVALSCMLLISVCTIVSYAVGKYKFDGYAVLTILFFLITAYEFERFRMMSFLLSKEALNAEKANLLKSKKEARQKVEKKMSLALLQQILPPKVADQVISGKPVVPESFEEVTIFFSDVVGFTNICAAVTPMEVVKMLNELYTVMDYVTSQFPLYKVETIGDAYMVVGGLPVRDARHAEQMADFALVVSRAVQMVKSPADGTPIRIRIGLHSGPVMAGVVGNLMPRYCLFGDTVNTASRMESNGEAGKIHCSSATAEKLMAAGKHDLIRRGTIEIKGKGPMTTFWLKNAKEMNTNSNDFAIERTEAMVLELLASADDFDHVATSTSLIRKSFSRNLGRIEEDEFSQDESGGDIAFSPSRSENLDAIIASVAAETGYESGSLRSPDSERCSSQGSVKVAGITESLSGRTSEGSEKGIAFSAVGRNSLHSIRFHLQHGSLEEADEGQYESTGAKVLVVEDSTSQRKMLVQKLKKADPTWDIKQASSGEDALTKLRAAKARFDVVFVDENLSMDDGLFGHELVHVMREDFKMDVCVIIACTSNPTKAAESLLAAGVDYVWPKPPPDAHVIKPKIDELLNQRIKYKLAETRRLAASPSEDKSSKKTDLTGLSKSVSASVPVGMTDEKDHDNDSDMGDRGGLVRQDTGLPSGDCKTPTSRTRRGSTPMSNRWMAVNSEELMRRNGTSSNSGRGANLSPRSSAVAPLPADADLDALNVGAGEGSADECRSPKRDIFGQFIRGGSRLVGLGSSRRYRR